MRPIVGISCCVKQFGSASLPNHAASDYAIRAVAEYADAVPILLPALGDATDFTALLGILDGVLLTGSRSNVNPALYGSAPHDSESLDDQARDATTLPLIRLALSRGLPLLAICRGFQELNVALGGTLHQNLCSIPGRHDHAAPKTDSIAEKYARAHAVSFTQGGLLHRLADAGQAMVNSLHTQGIDRLGHGLAIEARADDGTIEAARTTATPALALGVQWHPEYEAGQDALSRRIFAHFGEALRTRPGTMDLAAD